MAVRSTPRNPASPPATGATPAAVPGAGAAPTLIPQGPYAGKPPMPLHRPLILIGSRQRAHVHLVSNSVSRVHAAIINTDQGAYVRDLASRTGTLVNGRRVSETDLQSGDALQVGPFQFRFSDPRGDTAPAGGNRAPRAALIVQGRQAPLPVSGRTLLIGQRDTADLPLPSTAVSISHALVFELNGRHYIRDLGSRTGTFVNGQQIHQEALNVGDTIRIGETTMRYHAAAPAAAPVAAPRPAEQPVPAAPAEAAAVPIAAATTAVAQAVPTQGADVEPAAVNGPGPEPDAPPDQPGGFEAEPDLLPMEPEVTPVEVPPPPAAEELDLTVGAPQEPLDLVPGPAGLPAADWSTDVTATTHAGAGEDLIPLEGEPAPDLPPDLTSDLAPDLTPTQGMTTAEDLLGLEPEPPVDVGPAGENTARVDAADTAFDAELEAAPGQAAPPPPAAEAPAAAPAPPPEPAEPALPLDDPEPALADLESLLPDEDPGMPAGGPAQAEAPTAELSPAELSPAELSQDDLGPEQELPLDVATLEPFGPLTDVNLNLDGLDVTADHGAGEGAGDQATAWDTRALPAGDAGATSTDVAATADELLPEAGPAAPEWDAAERERTDASVAPPRDITATAPAEIGLPPDTAEGLTEAPPQTPAEAGASEAPEAIEAQEIEPQAIEPREATRAELELAPEEVLPPAVAAAPAVEEPPAAEAPPAKKGRGKKGAKKADAPKAAAKRRVPWGKKRKEAASAVGEAPAVGETPAVEPSVESEPQAVSEVSPDAAGATADRGPGMPADESSLTSPPETADVSAVAGETVAATEPSPESALDLGPADVALPAASHGDAAAGAEPVHAATADVRPSELEPLELDAAGLKSPSDDSFDRMLDEFAGPSTGPIVEQAAPVEAPAGPDVGAPLAVEPSPDEPTRLDAPPGLEESAGLTTPGGLDASGAPVAHDLDANAGELALPETPVVELAPVTDLTPLDELPLPPAQAEEPALAGTVGVTTHEAFVPPEPSPLEFPEESAAAAADTITVTPPGDAPLPPVAELAPEAAPPPPPAGEPNRAAASPPAPGPAPLPGLDPFFGMGLDEGSFIGGMPIALPPLGPPAPAAPRPQPARAAEAQRDEPAPAAAPRAEAAPPAMPPAPVPTGAAEPEPLDLDVDLRLPDLPELDLGDRDATRDELFDDAALSLPETEVPPAQPPARVESPAPPAPPPAPPKAAALPPQLPPRAQGPARQGGRPQLEDPDQVDPLAFGEAEAETLRMLPKPSGLAPAPPVAPPAGPPVAPPPAPAARDAGRNAPKPASKYPATPPPPARGGRARQAGQRTALDRGPLEGGLAGLGLAGGLAPDAKGPPPPGGAHAFDGLALPPVREADVFAPLPFGGAGGPGFGAGARAGVPPRGTDLGDAAAPTFDVPDADPAATPPAAGLVGLTGAGAAPSPAGRRGGLGPDGGGAPFDAPHLAAGDRVEVAPLWEPGPGAAGGLPPGAAPARRSRLGIGLLLAGMILCLAAAAAGIWFLGPKPGVRVVGTLQFDRLRDLSELDRRQFEQRQRDLLIKDVRPRARDILKTADMNAASGILDERDLNAVKAYEQMVQEAQVRERTGNFTLAFTGSDPAGDPARLRAVVKALYTINRPDRDVGDRLRRQYDDAQRRLKDLAEQTDRLKQEAAALRARVEAMPELEAKLRKLQQEDDKLRAAAVAARREVDRVRAQLERAELGPGAGTFRPGSSGGSVPSPAPREAAALASAGGAADAEAVALRTGQAGEPRSGIDSRRAQFAIAAAAQEEGVGEPAAADEAAPDEAMQDPAAENPAPEEPAPQGQATADDAPPQGDAPGADDAGEDAQPASVREVELAKLRKALAQAVAKEKQATAAADRSAAAVQQLKVEVAAAREADLRLNDVLNRRMAVEKEHEQQLTAAEKLRKELAAKVTPIEPGDDAVTATPAGEDRRYLYILFAGAAIVVAFSVLMWLSAHAGQPPAPATPFEAPPIGEAS